MPTRYQGTEKEVRALNAYIKLLRVYESVLGNMGKLTAGKNLTHSQFGVLEALYHLGPMSQVQIGKKILKSAGNITLVIDKLEKKELVRRERTENDRRTYRVSLTKKAEDLMKDYFPKHLREIVKVMSALSGPEQEQFANLCKKLGTSIPGN